MLNATEDLLENHSLGELNVSEVVRRAKSSTGSFYARFRDKQSLLDYIDETYGRQAVQRWKEFLAAERSKESPTFDVIKRIVTLMVVGHRNRRGVARALYLYVRQNPGSSTVGRRARKINEEVTRLIVEFLLERRKELRVQHPERAIRVALLSTVGAMREAVLFGELSSVIPKDEQLIEELANAFWNHIRISMEFRHA